MSGACKANITDLLRNITINSIATIKESSGWSYNSNIGHITNEAADEIERLQKENTELRQKLIDQQNYTLQLDRRQNADIQSERVG